MFAGLNGLAEATIHAYRELAPTTGALTLARLDSGSPWFVLKRTGKGAAAVVASPCDALGGSLPVNSDFIPLMHELVLELALHSADREARTVDPGEPLVFVIDPPPPPEIKTLTLVDPDQREIPLQVERTGTIAKASYANTALSGGYVLKGSAGTSLALKANVRPDPRELDFSPLSPADLTLVSQTLDLEFLSDPAALAERLNEPITGAPGAPRKREIWRLALFAVLGLFMLELLLSRRLARARGGPA